MKYRKLSVNSHKLKNRQSDNGLPILNIAVNQKIIDYLINSHNKRFTAKNTILITVKTSRYFDVLVFSF